MLGAVQTYDKESLTQTACYVSIEKEKPYAQNRPSEKKETYIYTYSHIQV